MTAGNPKTLMLVGAHHDDNELNTGTIQQHAGACHASQLPPKGSSEDNMIDLERIRARTRGLQAGCTFAEAFRFVPRAGKVRMAGLLG